MEVTLFSSGGSFVFLPVSGGGRPVEDEWMQATCLLCKYLLRSGTGGACGFMRAGPQAQRPTVSPPMHVLFTHVLSLHR